MGAGIAIGGGLAGSAMQGYTQARSEATKQRMLEVQQMDSQLDHIWKQKLDADDKNPGLAKIFMDLYGDKRDEREKLAGEKGPGAWKAVKHIFGFRDKKGGGVPQDVTPPVTYGTPPSDPAGFAPGAGAAPAVPEDVAPQPVPTIEGPAAPINFGGFGYSAPPPGAPAPPVDPMAPVAPPDTTPGDPNNITVTTPPPPDVGQMGGPALDLSGAAQGMPLPPPIGRPSPIPFTTGGSSTPTLTIGQRLKAQGATPTQLQQVEAATKRIMSSFAPHAGKYDSISALLQAHPDLTDEYADAMTLGARKLFEMDDFVKLLSPQAYRTASDFRMKVPKAIADQFGFNGEAPIGAIVDLMQTNKGFAENLKNHQAELLQKSAQGTATPQELTELKTYRDYAKNIDNNVTALETFIGAASAGKTTEAELTAARLAGTKNYMEYAKSLDKDAKWQVTADADGRTILADLDPQSSTFGTTRYLPDPKGKAVFRSEAYMRNTTDYGAQVDVAKVTEAHRRGVFGNAELRKFAARVKPEYEIEAGLSSGVANPSYASMQDYLKSLGQTVTKMDGKAPPPWEAGGGDTGGMVAPPSGAAPGKPNMAQRHLNPLNMKLGEGTQKWIDQGVAEVGEAATDGGKFLKFKSEADGYQAAMGLLSSSAYANLTVGQAMMKWSNSGYGADVLPSVDPDMKLKDMDFFAKAELLRAMAKREGYTTSTAISPPPK